MKKNYKCDICFGVFTTKEEIINDLKGHIDDAAYDIDTAKSQLEDLGIENI